MRFSVCWARCGSSLQGAANAIDLVQELLEPELVNLVDDDEEQLVVLRPLRSGLLERQQLVNLR